MFFKIGALKIFANFTGKHLCSTLCSTKGLQLYQKEAPTQVLSHKICEIFTEHLPWLLPHTENLIDQKLPFKTFYHANKIVKVDVDIFKT